MMTPLLNPCGRCRYTITCTSEQKQAAVDNGDCERYEESIVEGVSEAGGS